MRLRNLHVTLVGVFIASYLAGCSTMRDRDSIRTELSAALANMGAAANAHDVDRHGGFYAHDESTTLLFNGEQITGWDTILAKQREWWSNGNTDVVYTVQGKPEVRALKRDLAVTTLLMTSRGTGPDGAMKEGSFAVSALWQRRAEGWRVIYPHESTAH